MCKAVRPLGGSKEAVPTTASAASVAAEVGLYGCSTRNAAASSCSVAARIAVSNRNRGTVEPLRILDGFAGSHCHCLAAWSQDGGGRTAASSHRALACTEGAQDAVILSLHLRMGSAVALAIQGHVFATGQGQCRCFLRCIVLTCELQCDTFSLTISSCSLIPAHCQSVQPLPFCHFRWSLSCRAHPIEPVTSQQANYS